MNQEPKTKALLLENDQTVLEKIQQALKDRPYELTCFSTKKETLNALKETFFNLVITGHNAEGEDPIQVMKAMVMTSPMTSIIMVTDLSHEEAEEKAEGFGILGNVSRDVPSGDLLSLMDTYEKIQQSFPQG